MGRAAAIGAVIFDFNGTISDDEPLLAEIFLQLLREEGHPVGREEYWAELAGYSDQEILERGIGEPLPAARFQSLLRRKTDLYRARVGERSPVAPAAAAFVRAAAERVPVAIASGAPREEIELVLAGAGLADVFAAVVGLEDVERGKPDPEGYLLALARLRAAAGTPDLAAARALVFEDADPGVRAAKAAGMHCVALRNPAYTGAPVAADAVVDRLGPELVEQLLQPS